MTNKISKSLLIVMFMMFMLTACQQTPSTTNINNMPTKDNVSGTEETIDEESLPVINMSYEIVNEVFMAGDKTITLNGYIGKPDSLEGMCTYNANLVEHKKYMENMDFLFGDLQEQVEVESGYSHVAVYDDFHEYPIYIADLCNEIQEDKNCVRYNATWVPLSGETIPVNMTMEEAISKADEILEKIGVEGFILETVGYFDEVPMEGYWPNGDYYSVTYRQFLQGVPVGAVTTKKGYDISYAEVRIQERGIELVSIEQLDYYVDRQIEECITYEEAVEMFLNYVNTSSQYEDFGLESIAFEYVVKEDNSTGEYDFTVVPCWRFGVDNHWLKDIVIEAENGNLSCINSTVHSYYGRYDRLYGLGVE